MTDKAEDVTVRLRGFIGLKNTHSLWEYAAALTDAFDCLVAKNALIASQAAEIERLRKQHGLWHETSIPQLYAENASQAGEIERLRADNATLRTAFEINERENAEYIVQIDDMDADIERLRKLLNAEFQIPTSGYPRRGDTP